MKAISFLSKFLFLNLGLVSAYAADTAPQQSFGQSLISMAPLLIIVVLFMYFVVIRPQSKRAKEQQAVLSSLKKGDEVLTTAGILGRIEKIADNFITLSIAENVNIMIQKPAIVSVMPKGTMKGD